MNTSRLFGSLLVTTSDDASIKARRRDSGREKESSLTLYLLLAVGIGGFSRFDIEGSALDEARTHNDVRYEETEREERRERRRRREMRRAHRFSLLSPPDIHNDPFNFPRFVFSVDANFLSNQNGSKNVIVSGGSDEW